MLASFRWAVVGRIQKYLNRKGKEGLLTSQEIPKTIPGDRNRLPGVGLEPPAGRCEGCLSQIVVFWLGKSRAMRVVEQ